MLLAVSSESAFAALNETELLMMCSRYSFKSNVVGNNQAFGAASVQLVGLLQSLLQSMDEAEAGSYPVVVEVSRAPHCSCERILLFSLPQPNFSI